MTALNPKGSVGQHLLLAFHGKDRLPDEILWAMREYRPGGFTLFRSLNIESPAQVRELTGELQRAARAADLPPLLLAADQEGGQLLAIGDGVTQLPGNMALGAAGSTELARRAGQVLGTELAAMGINVNYAPCCDVNNNPANPVIGVRSFGEDPQMVARLAAALVEGIQSVGVAATAKHFPGHGDTAGDSHHTLPAVPHSLERLRSVELPPFGAAIRAGVRLVMTAHLAMPALDGPAAPPATLSPRVLDGLLRGELGFRGVIVTDSMEMQAVRQGADLGAQAVRALRAGADLLLMASDAADHRMVWSALLQAAKSGGLEGARLSKSRERIKALKAWLESRPPAPGLEVVGCAAHREVADEIAGRSITLVRDRLGLLPLRGNAGGRLAVILPRPIDLTPADTSSYVVPQLAAAVRRHHPAVDEFILPHAPADGDIAALLPRLAEYDAIVLGTIDALHQPAQAALARAVLSANPRTVVVALRLPYDLSAFPEASTCICTYSILEPSMRAAADALFGMRGFEGKLPVTLPEPDSA